MRRLVSVLGVLALLIFLVYMTVEIGVNRIYVGPDESLLLRYKGGIIIPSPVAKPGEWAKPGEVGVLRAMPGAGRHFYSPIWWERKVVKNILIRPGEVGLVTSKMGSQDPNNPFLVDGTVETVIHKGVLRKVLTPGSYRVNPHGFDVKITKLERDGDSVAGWVEVPTGYVAVVTNKVPDPRLGEAPGVQDRVLQPGVYQINPAEKAVTIIEVGYRLTKIETKVKLGQDGLPMVDEEGEPIITDPDSGISFPSKDGYKIHVDYNAVWGIMPDKAAAIVRNFGTLDQVEQKIVVGKIDAIHRTNGSELHATSFLVGEEREGYQTDSEKEVMTELEKKGITVLTGLVKKVYVPSVIRKPTQQAYIADEQRLTAIQEQETAKAEALFLEAERKVTLASKTAAAETERLKAASAAGAQKKAANTKAITDQQVAAIEKETAIFEADAIRAQGEATQKGEQLKAEAKAELFQLAVEAFGSPEAYNRWLFANNLPEELKLNMIYAGSGTLWTDSKQLNIQTQAPSAQAK